MFWKWLTTRKTTQPRHTRASLQIETLEDRTVPTALVALTTSQQLLIFDSASPTLVRQTPTISGLQGANESILSIDSRPANGVIYGLSNKNRLYTIDAQSAVATRVGNTPPDFALSGGTVGIDFNPTVDRLRVVTNADQNFRFNPNNGLLVDGDGGTGGVQPDTPLAYAAGDSGEGKNPLVTGVAYDRNFQGATLTTLFGIDADRNRLVRVGGIDGTPSPNGGQLTTVGSLGLDVNKKLGFEIDSTGAAFGAFLTSNGLTRLYTIDLTTGDATSLGRIGNGTFNIISLTSVTPLGGQVVYASTTTNNLVSFFAGDPNTLLSSVPITGLLTGETIAGLDFRPLNGVLYGLTSTNRVVTINLATGATTADGTVGGTFDPVAQAGFDFNPTVDRLRLVNAADDNARYNPVTSTFVQDDTALAYIATDVNVGADPNVVGSAYDRNDNDGGTATTLFGIDSTLNILVRQGAVDGNAADVAGGGSPNGGLLTTIGSLNVDPTDLVGFDIVDAGTMGSGGALAVMQLQGETVSKLFSINLSAGLTNQPVGSATLIGTVGGGELISAMAIAPPIVQFSAPIYKVFEDGGQAIITISRTGSTTATTTVEFSTSDGTATAGQDYTAVLNLVVTFNPGETVKTVTVPIRNKAGSEPTETVNLTLANVSGGNAIIGPLGAAVLRIRDVN